MKLTRKTMNDLLLNLVKFMKDIEEDKELSFANEVKLFSHNLFTAAKEVGIDYFDLVAEFGDNNYKEECRICNKGEEFKTTLYDSFKGMIEFLINENADDKEKVIDMIECLIIIIDIFDLDEYLEE